MKSQRVVALVLLTGMVTATACGAGTSTEELAPTKATQKTAATQPVVSARAETLNSWKLKQFPSRIVNRLGVASTEAYDAIARRSTTDHPYGPLAGGGSYPAIKDRAELVRRSGAAVFVEVVSISNPHFNSNDGGVRIHPEGGIDGSPVQDVRVRVLDRWGNRLGLPETFDLVVVGGQIEFFLNDEQAKAARFPKAGRYVTGMIPSDDLTVGEQALLLIRKGVVGWEGGDRQALVVAGGNNRGKFKLEGNTVKGEWSGSISEFKNEVRSQLGADCPDAGYCPTR